MTPLGFNFQDLENEALRRSLGMRPEQSGILVNEVGPLAAVNGTLKEQDVVLEVDGVVIGNDCTVPLRGKERISFIWLITGRVSGPTKFKVLRDREEIDTEANLVRGPSPYIAPRYHEADCQPSYYIVGGLVFTRFTLPLFEEALRDPSIMVESKLAQKAIDSFKQEDGEEIVLLLRILTHDVNYGYNTRGQKPVEKFNGVEVKSLRHLAEMVESCEDPFMKFELPKKKLSHI